MKPIVILGEAWGENEARISQAFVGSSGIELAEDEALDLLARGDGSKCVAACDLLDTDGIAGLVVAANRLQELAGREHRPVAGRT